MPDSEKQTIGRYEVIKSIGKGAQGIVYLGRDPALDRLVAIKIMTNSDADLTNMTEDGVPLEGRISGKLKHPNIIPVYDAGECEVGPFLVFEFVEGETLAKSLGSTGPLTVEKAVPMIALILDAVSTAHGADILHLDLNPRNVLIDNDGMPRVMDFGLAQFFSTSRERSEFATGTLRYMSPEHFLGQPLGPWTDVFALGSTFYEVITGQRAMAGTVLEEIQARIISGDVDFGPLKADPHGEAFARFLAGALECRQEGRYADCTVMKEAFDLFLSEVGLTEQAQAAVSNHSTVDFLLRRMQRTGDFPTISRTLSDINRLTGDDDPGANADKLANVILRDFALTSKLLKLVNSSFYGARATEITNISDAVVLLGVEQVRMTANSLTFFGAMKGDSAVLKDSMTKSFLAGLISRHLAKRERLRAAEEAFICGMCQNLGENLVIFYFPDEFDAITGLQQDKQLGKAAAARGVLGVDYAELGAAVAKSWNLPQSITEAIRGVPPGPMRAPDGEDEQLRDLAVFASELCDMIVDTKSENADAALQALLDRFGPSVALDADYLAKLIDAAFDKLKQYAPIFEISVASSNYCKSVQAWLAANATDDEDAVAQSA
ncbi:MAG: HDOD domain-containing protein [Gammaproteobacteria bacterium]|nr:HDOD domain-containing protein [Gammaproteobacteria bacterium]